MTAFRRIELGR